MEEKYKYIKVSFKMYKIYLYSRDNLNNMILVTDWTNR